MQKLSHFEEDFKKGKPAIFDQMGHRQTNTSRQERAMKLHSVARGKADDHERPFSIDAPKCLLNVVT